MDMAQLKQIQEAFKSGQIDYGQDFLSSARNNYESNEEQFTPESEKIEEVGEVEEAQGIQKIEEIDIYYSVSEMLRRQK